METVIPKCKKKHVPKYVSKVFSFFFKEPKDYFRYSSPNFLSPVEISN